MNGEVCRLRDIHELFMDTGLGSKAYSIIEQGKIGLILSSKPADRRALIEEAAGITKYKARRRQTQLKLEAAQQNLLRVNDIVHEVEKQLESLKRQASKARRYRVVREEMQGGRARALRPALPRPDAAVAVPGGAPRRRGQSASAPPPSPSRPRKRRSRCAASISTRRKARLEEVRGRLSELTLAVDRHQGRSGLLHRSRSRRPRPAPKRPARKRRSWRREWDRLRNAYDAQQREEARLRDEADAAEKRERGGGRRCTGSRPPPERRGGRAGAGPRRAGRPSWAASPLSQNAREPRCRAARSARAPTS